MDHRQTKLLSKQGIIVTQIADDLLSRSVDDRVPSIQDYAALFDASVGTVQSAVNYLQSEDGVDLVSRGRLGAYIEKIDYRNLWSIAKNRLIVGIQPLPYSRLLAGLATALRIQFSENNMDSNCRYVRGSSTRMQMLQSNQCDWIVVSRYAAETASVHGFDIEVVTTLGANTYTINQVLLVRDELGSQLQDGMRVGIDTNSTDQAYLVRSITRKHAIRFVEIEYQRGLELLLSGEIDATIWTSTDLPPSGVNTIAIDHQQDRFQSLNEAVIVIRPNDSAVKNILNSTIDIDVVCKIQHEVMTSQRLASY